MEQQLSRILTGPAREESLAEQAYRRVKQNILNLTYAPGSDLTEARLSQEMDMSRMPIRMAMQRLEQEGWLTADFRKKTKVRAISRQDVVDLYEFRRLIELPAMSRIFSEGRTWDYSFLMEQGLLRIRACRDDLYLRERAETDLHMAIVGVLDNQRINRIYQQAQDELIRIGLLFVKPEDAEDHYIDHIISGWERIVLAVRENREQEALEIFDRDHISGALALALKRIEEESK